MLRKGMIWMPMDKKDQLAELISNAETSFYNGQLQEAFSLSLSAIKLDENCNISSSRQSSNHVKVHSGNAVRNYKSRYGKGIRPTYTVLQIKADSPVNGADVFWYEGNCSILGSKNVYIGYNDNSMSVVSQFELVMTIISGAFLLFHTVSARLLSKKNPYGGKLFWFFKF